MGVFSFVFVIESPALAVWAGSGLISMPGRTGIIPGLFPSARDMNKTIDLCGWKVFQGTLDATVELETPDHLCCQYWVNPWVQIFVIVLYVGWPNISIECEEDRLASRWIFEWRLMMDSHLNQHWWLLLLSLLLVMPFCKIRFHLLLMDSNNWQETKRLQSFYAFFSSSPDLIYLGSFLPFLSYPSYPVLPTIFDHLKNLESNEEVVNHTSIITVELI